MTRYVASAGKTSSGTVLNTGDFQEVYGTAVGTKVHGGGVVKVQNGGTSIDTGVSSGRLLGLRLARPRKAASWSGLPEIVAARDGSRNLVDRSRRNRAQIRSDAGAAQAPDLHTCSDRDRRRAP